MKLIIDIPKEVKEAFDNADDINFCFYDYNSTIGKAIRNGTPLPKEHGAEPLDCGNCEIVQASINTGIRTASRLVDDVLDKIRTEISDFEEEVFHRPNTDYSDYAAVRHCLEIIDRYRNEVTS